MENRAMRNTPMYDDLVELWATKDARHDDAVPERGENATPTQNEEMRLHVSDDAAPKTG
jgi:hypothetical protein